MTMVPGVGHGAGGRHLIAEVLEEVLGRAPIEVVPARELFEGRRGRQPQQVVHQAPDGETELERTSRAVALPERHLPRLPWRRRDEHAVVGDLLDAPRRGAKHERLADVALEDHFLVELADPRVARAGADRERRRTIRDPESCRRWRWRPASPPHAP